MKSRANRRTKLIMYIKDDKNEYRDIYRLGQLKCRSESLSGPKYQLKYPDHSSMYIHMLHM